MALEPAVVEVVASRSLHWFKTSDSRSCRKQLQQPFSDFVMCCSFACLLPLLPELPCSVLQGVETIKTAICRFSQNWCLIRFGQWVAMSGNE